MSQHNHQNLEAQPDFEIPQSPEWRANFEKFKALPLLEKYKHLAEMYSPENIAKMCRTIG